MNIFCTITRCWPAIGGAELMLREISRRLSPHHVVTIAAQINTNQDNWLLSPTLEAPIERSIYDDDGTTIELIPLTKTERKIVFQFIARPFLQRFSNHVLLKIYEKKIIRLSHDAHILHNYHMGMDYLSLASCNAARKTGKPFAFTPFFHPDKVRMSPAFNTLCRNADIVFVLSNSEKEIVRKERGSARGIVRIATGPVLAEQYSTDAFRAKYNLSGKPLVLFLGQKFSYKGCDRMLKATRRVWEEEPETVFMFIGPHYGQSRDIFAQYHDRRIIDLDAVDLTTKTAALATADIFCQPSLKESFGAVFLEAWTMGLPVIGGNTPAVREIIDDGVNGFLVSENIDELADRIITLLKDRTLRNKMSVSGKQKLASFQSWESISRTVFNAYEHTVQTRHE